MFDKVRDFFEDFNLEDIDLGIVWKIMLVFGILIAVGALTVLIISLVRLKKNKRADEYGPSRLPDGVDNREAFYAGGETSERRTVIAPGMPPYVTDSTAFAEQPTTAGPNSPYNGGNGFADMPTAAQPAGGGMPYVNMGGMEGRTVSVRDLHRGGTPAPVAPVQPTPVQPTPGYAPMPQQPYQAAAQVGGMGTVNVRGQAERPATQVDRYSYAQPQQPSPSPYGQPQGPSGIGELVIRYTLPGRGEQTQRFAQPQEITIGRDSGNKLVLPYESVSNHHARLDCVGGEVFITNVSRSVNGLQNNLTVDRRDVTERTKLPNGCQINLGMVPITVSWTAGSAASTPASVPVSIPTPAPAAANNPDGVTVRPNPTATVRQSVGVNDDWTVRGNDGMLIVSWELAGRRSSKRINLTDSVSIGRDPGDTVHIEDPTRTVSKHHLLVTHDNNGELIVRNGSRVNPQYGKNPFFVSGQRVVDEIAFTDGMSIKAGQAMITLTREGT